jgi:uncharacterized protein YhfF
MNVLAVFYHAHPIVWTTATIGIAYAFGKGETDRVLDRWREMHRKTFSCQAREPHEN